MLFAYSLYIILWGTGWWGQERPFAAAISQPLVALLTVPPSGHWPELKNSAEFWNVKDQTVFE